MKKTYLIICCIVLLTLIPVFYSESIKNQIIRNSPLIQNPLCNISTVRLSFPQIVQIYDQNFSANTPLNFIGIIFSPCVLIRINVALEYPNNQFPLFSFPLILNYTNIYGSNQQLEISNTLQSGFQESMITLNGNSTWNIYVNGNITIPYTLLLTIEELSHS